MILFRWFERKDIADNVSRAFQRVIFSLHKLKKVIDFFTFWPMLKFAALRFLAVFPLTRLFSKMQIFCSSSGCLQRSALLKVGF
jgi:hypothetical protein